MTEIGLVRKQLVVERSVQSEHKQDDAVEQGTLK